MVRRTLLALPALLLLSTPALAGRAKVPALEPATVRAEPKADAAAVVEIKKGDKLMVLGKQGDWSQVLTDGGKKGWVQSKVVSAGGLSTLDANATTVAAAEGDTAMAMRGRPSAPRTIVVGMGGTKSELTKQLGDLIQKDSKLKVLEVRDEAATKAGSPAGGVDGAAELAAGKKAEVVVAIQAAQDGNLAYEIVDLKDKKVLGTGTSAKVEDVAAAVATATADLVKNPAAAGATPEPTAKAAAPDATPTGNRTLKKITGGRGK